VRGKTFVGETKGFPQVIAVARGNKQVRGGGGCQGGGHNGLCEEKKYFGFKRPSKLGGQKGAKDGITWLGWGLKTKKEKQERRKDRW